MPGPISVLLEVRGSDYGWGLAVAKARSYQREVLNSARSYQVEPLAQKKIDLPTFQCNRQNVCPISPQLLLKRASPLQIFGLIDVAD